MFIRGAVFFYRNFTYYDNQTVADKYLILLNTPAKNDLCLLVPATKRSKGRPKKQGCQNQHQSFFLPANTTNEFSVDTWLPLHPLYPCYPKAIAGKKVGDLSEKLINEIVECAIESAGEDYQQNHKKLLQPPLSNGKKNLLDLFNKRRNR